MLTGVHARDLLMAALVLFLLRCFMNFLLLLLLFVVVVADVITSRGRTRSSRERAIRPVCEGREEKVEKVVFKNPCVAG